MCLSTIILMIMPWKFTCVSKSGCNLVIRRDSNHLFNTERIVL